MGSPCIASLDEAATSRLEETARYGEAEPGQGKLQAEVPDRASEDNADDQENASGGSSYDLGIRRVFQK